VADNWKKKYFDSLESLEKEQQQFRAIEGVLKRLVSRLSIASRGQSPKLDDEIKSLQAALRREPKSEELEKIATALTDAINALDQPQASTPVELAQPLPKSADAPRETLVVDDRIRSVLSALLVDLRRDPELVIQVDALDAKLAVSMQSDQLPGILTSLTELVGKRIRRIEHTKQELEVLLSQMVGRLDEISRFVADQSQHQNQSRASSETLNTHLVGEMKAMGESVESAHDVQQIRTQVRSRLDSIDRHLQEFRQREVTLSSAIKARNEQMSARVAELEAEAKRLHHELKDEQRLSLIDPLTKIPNRLAYEKRIDEELKRWQRFKQPTCITAWDVDHFKRVNDTFGHSTGDRVLRAVAECLTDRIRGTDFLARYGGEEFVMILCGTKVEDALRLCDEIRIAIANLKMHSRGTPLAITISCGVTALLPGDSAGAAFERADKALYQAKDLGRNRSVSI
jgi:diguanylate cyclase